MRLFVAIELDREVKQALIDVQGQLGEFSRVARWARPEQMHLTVKFLGETPDQKVEAVCAAAGRVAGQVGPFQITLTDCGCFPPRGAVRIVQRGLADETQTLHRCRDLCEETFAELGFERERRAYAPHLTIGRVRDDRTGGQLRAAVEGITCQPISQSVEALCVVRSELSPGGAKYTNIAEHKFTGGA